MKHTSCLIFYDLVSKLLIHWKSSEGGIYITQQALGYGGARRGTHSVFSSSPPQSCRTFSLSLSPILAIYLLLDLLRNVHHLCDISRVTTPHKSSVDERNFGVEFGLKWDIKAV